ncbi:unnamed protein product [Rhizoctonia solani]|uniref:Uncharacterized protein n=1 Tax=Rhizoctonia solani TaxID=456999 RepID=A0A8H2XGQ3_9AGAM|nr:unnamed protein product [Rhizoctonia solani]
MASAPLPTVNQSFYQHHSPEEPGAHSESHRSVPFSSDLTVQSPTSASTNVPPGLTRNQASLREPKECSSESLGLALGSRREPTTLPTIPSAYQAYEGKSDMPPGPFRSRSDTPKGPVVPLQAISATTRDRLNYDNVNTERDARSNTTYTDCQLLLGSLPSGGPYVRTEGPEASNSPLPPSRFLGNLQEVDHPHTDPASVPEGSVGQVNRLPYSIRPSNAFLSNHVSRPPSYDLVQARPSTIHIGSNNPYTLPQNFPQLTSGQASLYYSLISLAGSHETSPTVTPHRATSRLTALQGPNCATPDSSRDQGNNGNNGSMRNEDNIEDIKQTLYAAIAPDTNTEANALPFVLQGYLQWLDIMVLDPKHVAQVIRGGVITLFSSSQHTRTRVILLSNVFRALTKSRVLNSESMLVLSYLRVHTQQILAHFTSTKPAPLREADMTSARKSIEIVMEVILLHRFGGSMSTIVELMEAASPVFRRACPEPLGQPVNLSKLLLSPSIDLPHYAKNDIILATFLARRMFLQYYIVYTPETNEQFAEPQAGLRWLHGIPDQFIILLAWINTLHEDLGSNVDPLIVSQIEVEAERVKVTPNISDDPAQTVRKLAVQECWRLVVCIHLYVTLQGAHASHPSVVKYVKRFMRFFKGIKAADTFLSLPVIFIGTFVSREQDRDLLFRRLTALQGCAMPSYAEHGCLMVLCDVWKRTEQERRPATRADLRISCQTILGV